MTFDEWNRQQVKPIVRDTGRQILAGLYHEPPAIDVTQIAPLAAREAVDRALTNGSTVWTPEVQALEAFRQGRLCRPPYKKPGWRPKA